ncbi:MAG: hypothetical protein ACR2NO_02905 [Chloroflexota bacterium]
MTTKNDQARARAYFEDARAFGHRENLSSGRTEDHDETMPDRVRPEKLSPSAVLAEYAHVVYASGFRVSVLEGRWDELRRAWRGFDPAKIDDHAAADAMNVIAHPKKVDAIARTAALLRTKGIAKFRSEYLKDVTSLAELPFMGPIIRFHLARNLGVDWDVAKPDVWLVRAADTLGYGATAAGAQKLSEFLAASSGLRVGVVDLILWKYLRLNLLPVQLRVLGKLGWIFERSDEILEKLVLASTINAEVSPSASVEDGWLTVGSLYFEGHKEPKGDGPRDDLGPVTLSWRLTVDEPIRPCVWGNFPTTKAGGRAKLRRSIVDTEVNEQDQTWQYGLRVEQSVLETADPDWLLDDWGNRVAALVAPNARTMLDLVPVFSPDDDPWNRDWIRILAAERRKKTGEPTPKFDPKLL